ncbi:MAG: Hsp20/alpha crystallin family protein [Furfurilactobacillus sp.]|jgi:HSP20 family protein|uniref:Hsp20/alpha crystallin family protein n=1 Tax=Furfurilactobacillus milii TaxID=2888272 RepID=A0ABT6DBV5_9LACO|nr:MULTISPECIES: Hsp20/alpha crystallin family protein [Furfurilactobacillus]QLE67486.1 small heat shock protein [Furfurilactobacillus rossiae]MCF6161703.1 Hsp20/alpha crystallin family protein [Furfurilactobacillus milii]MCF6164074.1 Hsp20/alpha crystallin family protein [Furfurilactobacillus milii]MCH4011618.1 Hsp20/alpha crystallin family protein [Furfurilactobacillus sp.]MCH4037510.1 Hsp20/alpha crystallin family protein [Furfurilactobacillus sp.]
MRYDLRNDDFNDPQDDFFFGFPRNMFDMTRHGGSMRADVVEHDKDFEVSAELPGFKKDGIKLQYNNDTLTIQAEHENDREDKDDDGRVLRHERSYSNVNRSFYLPNVDRDNIEAHYDGGVLTIKLPKTDASEERNHDIEIN